MLICCKASEHGKTKLNMKKSKMNDHCKIAAETKETSENAQLEIKRLSKELAAAKVAQVQEYDLRYDLELEIHELKKAQTGIEAESDALQSLLDSRTGELREVRSYTDGFRDGYRGAMDFVLAKVIVNK